MSFTKEMKDRAYIVPIEEELKNSYLTYSMSVIVSRALPDVRDGLKPSQRRILVAMNDLNLGPKAKFRKCAKISGDTSGNYHPHGEAVIYPTLVRMAQDFNMRYPLIDGQGNFGSLDGDPPAAMRYTEARMTAVTMEMLEDLEKETVNFVSNYDETRQEPFVLPSKFPNLLVNGSMGIAVGMSTSLPPNNLGEICDAIIKVIDEPGITPLQLCDIVHGPDFPTGAIICGNSSIKQAYCTGRGTITVRAKAQVEETKTKSRIIFSEIPYQLNKAKVIEHIADLVKEGKLKGISDVRDESDREHQVRIVVEVKRGENEDVILNQLYKYTSLQGTFSIIMIALVDGRPRLLNIKQLVECFIAHRQDVIRKRTQFLLKKAEARAHIVDGLMLCIKNIDAIISLIRSAVDAKDAKDSLIAKYALSPLQSDAILQMRLSSLTGLEHSKLKEERDLLTQRIEVYKKILGNEKEILNIIKEETAQIRMKYANKRRTQIGQSIDNIVIEDIIPDDTWAVMVTNKGYLKRMAIENYRKQHRGGMGISGADIQEGDFVEHFFTASAHQYILFFSNLGKAYWLKVYDIPELSRTSKGRAIVNLLNLAEGETITSLIPIREFQDNQFLMMATARGIVKKTPLSAFARPNKLGIKAIILDAGDSLIATRLTHGEEEVLLATKLGRACHFHEKDVRSMGRGTRGVKGCRLFEGDEIIGMVVAKANESLLTICEKGFVKRSAFANYRMTKRGAQGVLNLKKTDKTGNVVAVLSIEEGDEIMAITSQGMVIRTGSELRVLSRTSQGVKLIRLKEADSVVSVAKLAKEIVQQLSEKEEKEEPAEQDEKPVESLETIEILEETEEIEENSEETEDWQDDSEEESE